MSDVTPGALAVTIRSLNPIAEIRVKDDGAWDIDLMPTRTGKIAEGEPIIVVAVTSRPPDFLDGGSNGQIRGAYVVSAMAVGWVGSGSITVVDT